MPDQNRRTRPILVSLAALLAVGSVAGLVACEREEATEVTIGSPSTDEPESTTTTARARVARDPGHTDGALRAAAQGTEAPDRFTTTTEPEVSAPDTLADPAPTTTTTPALVLPAAAPEVTTTTAPPAPAPEPVVATPPPGGGASADELAFLACVRQRESGGNYSIVSSNGLYYGAYQFHRQTWDSTAANAGRPDLIGVPPNQASPADQDAMALALYRSQGKAPWGGYC